MFGIANILQFLSLKIEILHFSINQEINSMKYTFFFRLSLINSDLMTNFIGHPWTSHSSVSNSLALILLTFIQLKRTL